MYVCLESGLVPCGVREDSTDIPTSWCYEFVAQIPNRFTSAMTSTMAQQRLDSIGSSTVQLKLLNFSDECLSLVFRRLTNGDAVCISFCFGDQSRSVCFNVKEFVAFDGCTNDDFYAKIMRNAAQLANRTKSLLIQPIRNAVMQSRGLRFPNLNGLPRDVLHLLFKYLSLATLQNLSKTCALMRNEVVRYVDDSVRIVLTERRSTPIVGRRR